MNASPLPARRGSTLMATMILFPVAVIALLTILYIWDATARRDAVDERRTQARLLAESAIEYVTSQSEAPSSVTVHLNNGNYFSVRPEANGYLAAGIVLDPPRIYRCEIRVNHGAPAISSPNFSTHELTQ